jgi:hypothetical protein
MVGEIKKGRYVYYHCTGYRGKCPEPYTKEEEVLDREFSELLKRISFSDDVLSWVTDALRQSHKDEKAFHDEAIAKLKREHRRIQDRVDIMYTDRLDGRIDSEFFDRKAAEFRSEQARLMGDVQAHQSANQSYVEVGVRILQLAHDAHRLFESVEPAGDGNGDSGNWRATVDAFRTFLASEANGNGSIELLKQLNPQKLASSTKHPYRDATQKGHVSKLSRDPSRSRVSKNDRENGKSREGEPPPT